MKTKKNLIKILIAEDSPTQAEQLKYLLEKNNYSVIVAKDGKEALDLILKDKPSIVISDIIMPKMDGYKLCEKIKSDENTRDIPVILLTSLSDSSDVLKGLACGADNFLNKPYDEKHILSHIAQILANIKLHKGEIVRLGIEIVLGGKKRFITSTHQQMLSLLFSTYEAAVQKNHELQETQEELKSLNEHLETLVEARTIDLEKEIAVRKNSEEFNKRIIASSNDCIKVLDLKGNLLSMSEGGQTILEIDDIEIYLNKSWADFWKGDDNKAALNAIAKAKKGESATFTGFCPTEKGTPKWWEIIVSPIMDAQNEIYHLLAVSRDITERKKAEEKIIQASINWQTTFNAIDDIVMLLKPNHDIIDINEAGIIAIGKKREEIIGQKCYKLVHNTDAPIKECSCVNSIKTKEKSVTEIMQNNSNLELLSWPVLDDKNEIKAITHIVKDITSKKQAEEKIQEQNEFLNKIIESLTHPFYVIDANDYTISLANSASGFDSDTKKAKCHSLAHLSDKPCQSSEHPCPMEIVKKSKKPVVVEHIHNDKKGNPRNIEVHGYPIFDKNGKVIKMIEYCLDITERKLAKEALENAEIKFHTLFDTTTDAVMVLDTVNFLDCNPATLNMFGCATVEEFCSKHPADLSPPNQSDGTDSMTLANQRITTAMEKGTNIFEWIHKRADTGETFPAEVILSKMELYGKDVLQATVRDVTERKKMEEELKEREKHLASIIQNPAGYVIYRLKAGPDALSPIVTHVSPSITELTGISPEESKNYKKWFQRVHSGDLSRLIEANERGMKPPFIFEEEFRYNHPSKGLIWLHAKTNGIPYSNDPENIEWAHGILTDITDRKRADDEIGRMAQMLNVATNAITINDFKGNFLFANQKTYDLHGYSKDQIQALTLDKLYSPDTAKQMPARMKELSEHGKAKFQVEHCTKDGSIIPMEVYAQITKWGETNAILSIATDISERKLAEDEIMQQLTELQ